MGSNNLQDPRHQSVRTFLRITGPATLLAGVICAAVALVDFFQAGMPKLFWLFFMAFPLLFVGCAMTYLGFLGAFVRYQASEVAPVGKDAVNYMADGTQDGIRTIARAVGSGVAAGIADGKSAPARFCTGCGHANDGDDKFCGGCGQPLHK